MKTQSIKQLIFAVTGIIVMVCLIPSVYAMDCANYVQIKLKNSSSNNLYATKLDNINGSDPELSGGFSKARLPPGSTGKIKACSTQLGTVHAHGKITFRKKSESGPSVGVLDYDLHVTGIKNKVKADFCRFSNSNITCKSSYNKPSGAGSSILNCTCTYS